MMRQCDISGFSSGHPLVDRYMQPHFKQTMMPFRRHLPTTKILSGFFHPIVLPAHLSFNSYLRFFRYARINPFQLYIFNREFFPILLYPHRRSHDLSTFFLCVFALEVAEARVHWRRKLNWISTSVNQHFLQKKDLGCSNKVHSDTMNKYERKYTRKLVFFQTFFSHSVVYFFFLQCNIVINWAAASSASIYKKRTVLWLHIQIY